MSDTTAFLSGCIMTGLAAVLLLRGGFELSHPRAQALDPAPAPAISELPTPLPLPSSTPGLLDDSVTSVQLERTLERQRVAIEELEGKIDKQQNDAEKQQNEVEELRSQLERQQENMRQLVSQLQEQQRLVSTLAARQTSLAAPPDQGMQFQTFILWVMGGVILVVVLVGGVVLVGVIIILVQSQRRPSRPTHQEQPLPITYTLPQPMLLPSAQPKKQRFGSKLRKLS